MNLTTIQYRYIQNINSFKGRNIYMDARKDKNIGLFATNGAKILAKKAQFEVPENGKFSKVGIIFNIPNTQNLAHYNIEYDELEPTNTRRFSIGATRKGSDRLTSAYLIKGTKQEIIDFLKNEDNYTKFQETLKQVSKETDDYFSSLM